jgi:hypothetical protein
MAIRLDARELGEILTLTPARHNVMLVGPPGIGKSDMVRAFYTRMGLPVEVFFLGQMSDPGDLIGLMHKDEASGHSVFLPPYWWPSGQQPMVLFLDELNRARPEILQAVYDLALNRRLAGKTLPPDSRVVAAINHGEDYQLTDLDPALLSRFNLYEFAPTVEDWLLWATEQSLDARVLAFIQAEPFQLDGAHRDPQGDDILGDLNKIPDRRAWARVAEFVAPLARLEPLHIKAIAGMVGSSAAVAFHQHLAASGQLSAEQILLDWRQHQARIKALSLHETIQLNERLVLWMHGLAQPITEAERIRANLLAYLKRLKQLKRNEAIAHFASLLENPKYDRAMALCSGSVALLGLLTDYISTIRG